MKAECKLLFSSADGDTLSRVYLRNPEQLSLLSCQKVAGFIVMGVAVVK